MYPYPPTFLSGEPFDLWWSYSRSTGTDVCAIAPRAWMLRARSALGLSASAVWDQAFAEALVNAAAVLDREMPGTGWAAVLAELRSDLAARRPGRAGYEFATWFTFYRPSMLRFDALSFPPQVSLPAWGQVVPDAPSRQDPQMGRSLACFRVGLEPAVGTETAAALRAVERASALGIRERAGEPTEQGTDVVETGEAGVPLVALTILGALTLGAVWAFSSTARSKR